MKLRIPCLLTGLLVTATNLLVSAASSAAEPFLMSCASPEQQSDTVYLTNIIEPVLAARGYQLKYVTGQGPELVEMLKQGELDGDCARVEDFNEKAGLDLVRIKPIARRVKFAFWDYELGFDFHGQDKTEVRVGYLSTTLIAPQLARQVGFSNLHSYSSMAAMNKALDLDEIDIAINYQALVSGYNKHSERKLLRVRHIVTIPVYIYIHKRHQALIPLIAEAISARVKSRPYESYSDKAIPPLGKDRIVFGCPVPTRSASFNRLEQIYKEAFQLLGYDFQMVALPRQRAKAELLAGNVDGTCARNAMPPYSTSPLLQRLQVPVANVSLQLLSREAMTSITHITQLPTGSVVAYVRGTEAAKQLLKQAPSVKAVDVTTAEIGIKMLAAGRVDFFIGMPIIVDYVLAHLDIR